MPNFMEQYMNTYPWRCVGWDWSGGELFIAFPSENRSYPYIYRNPDGDYAIHVIVVRATRQSMLIRRAWNRSAP